jgi:hypothetical protein
LILLTSLLMKEVKKKFIYEEEKKGWVGVASKLSRYSGYKVSLGQINF